VSAMDRRTFLKGLSAAGLFLGSPLGAQQASQPVSQVSSSPSSVPASAPNPNDFVRAAAFCSAASANSPAQCHLCPHECLIPEGERGRCGTRQTREGKIQTLIYGRSCKAAINPIEDSGIWHYLPGDKTLTLAAAGCNFSCRGCNQWELSQCPPELAQSLASLSPEVLETCRVANCTTLAFDLTEPSIDFEWLSEILPAARAAGLNTVLSTNGYIQSEPLAALLPHISAMRIDLKGFNSRFYTDFCGGRLDAVLATIKQVRASDTWLEVSYPLIDAQNDLTEWTEAAAAWVMKNLGADIPLHFLCHTPHYRLKDGKATSERTLTLHRKLAMRAGLHFVYVHGIEQHEGLRTYCPSCLMVIASRITGATQSLIEDGKCPFCNHPIAGLWKKPSFTKEGQDENVV